MDAPSPKLRTYRRTIDWLKRQAPPDAGAIRTALGVGLTATQYGLGALRRSARYHRRLTGVERRWAEGVRRDGFCVVPEFLDRATCDRYVAEIERLFGDHPEHVHRRSDRRIFGAEKGSAPIRSFADDERLRTVAEAIFGEPTVNAFTMCARLDYVPGNLGSGEGWHRDSFVMQAKAIVYLSDVGDDHGPFQLIVGSERPTRVFGDMVQGRLGFEQNRVDDAQVDRLLAARPARLRTFTAPAGTLILVNTSAIHRGCPIRAGTRYALTNYYFPTRRLGPDVLAHFAPVLGAATSGAGAPA